MDIAVAAQAIVQMCVVGGSRLGGQKLIGGSGGGSGGLVSLYVGRAPERSREKPLLPFSLVPTTSSDRTGMADLTMEYCGKVPF